uniref:Uncharacterized protein n=1 Tax=Rhizophora mucronata TaxID=61149 RepID=A0A2P2QQW9_RHIMU
MIHNRKEQSSIYGTRGTFAHSVKL